MRNFFFSVLCAGLVYNLAALEPEKALRSYQLEIWKAERGLPQNSIFKICQTREGYLLLGTQDGLVSFDGVRFSLFPTGRYPFQPGGNIKVIQEDRQGKLWVGGDAGLTCWSIDGKRNTYSRQSGLNNTKILKMLEASDGTFWIGSTEGVNLIKEEKVLSPSFLEQLPRSWVRGITEDSEGRIWIAFSEEGLFSIKGGRISRLGRSEGLYSERVFSLLADREGSLWIGTEASVDIMQNGRIRSYPIGGKAKENVYAVTLFQDSSGCIWIGTDKGLFRFQKGQFESLSVADGLPSNAVYSIMEDPEGSLWIGTIDGGLVRLKEEKFSFLSVPHGLPSVMIHHVYVGHDGRIWIGSDGGLSLYSDGAIVDYSQLIGLPKTKVLRIEEDTNHYLFIGTPNGLFKTKGGRVAILPAIADTYIFAIFNASNGDVWVGSMKGIHRVHGDGVDHLADAASLQSNYVSCFCQDRSGRIWIGTNRGLHFCDPPGFSSFQNFTHIPPVIVNTLYCDAEANIWIGTSEGLKLVTAGGTYSFTQKGDFFDYSVETILADDHDNLWLGTKQGIVCIPRAEMLDRARGGRNPLHPQVFRERDGLRSRYCNGAGAVTGKGESQRLWFPTINGLAVIEPNHVKSNKIPPPVLIEEMIVDGRTMPLHERRAEATAEIGPGIRRVEFRFTALSFLQPERVRFKYRLDGYDRDWIASESSNRLATYTNIPPGKYTFRVIACNNDGLWNEEGAAAAFYLKPYLYQRPLFYVFLSILSILGIFLLITYRTRSLEGRRRELEQRVKEKTRELADANLELKSLNERISQANTDLGEINLQLRDEIDEKERAREALRQTNEKLKELDRLKTEFLNMVSHELRTPLTSVVGFAKMIRKKQDELLSPLLENGNKKIERSVDLVKKDIDIIIHEGERLTAMINDLLDIAKLESGKTVWHMDTIKIRDIIQNAFAYTASLFEQKKLQRRIEIEENLPPVIGDRDRLIQVLINLLSNAVKFTDSGQVTCRARLLADDSASGGKPFVEISVADTGIGIATEHVEKLFDKFIQIREGRNTFMKGTGLGLSICKQIVEHHGGRIWVRSEGSRGSTFLFTVPAAR